MLSIGFSFSHYQSTFVWAGRMLLGRRNLIGALDFLFGFSLGWTFFTQRH